MANKPQNTPKIGKTANLKHLHLKSEVNVSTSRTSNISHCVKPVSPPPSSDAQFLELLKKYYYTDFINRL